MQGQCALLASRKPICQSYIEISRYVRQHLFKPSSQGSIQPSFIIPSNQRRQICNPRLAQARAISIDDCHETTTYLRRRSKRSLRQVSRSYSHVDDTKTTPARDGSNISQRNSVSMTQRGEEVAKSFQASEHFLTEKLNTWADLDNMGKILNKSSSSKVDPVIHLAGYVSRVRRANARLHFLELVDPQLSRAIQVVAATKSNKAAGLEELEASSHIPSLDSIPAHTPVIVNGTVQLRKSSPNPSSESSGSNRVLDPSVGTVRPYDNIEILLESIKFLNSWPQGQTAQHGQDFPPEQRHLTFRTDQRPREDLRFRSDLKISLSKFLQELDFCEVETPLLFKSTPEGAREFLVPSRQPGLAYALPQSPQQYKQILMASAFPKYFQFARCFRDEDGRSDRQPEFTQLDLEMAFGGAESVRSVVEELMLKIVWPHAERMHLLNKDVQDKISGLEKRNGGNALVLPTLTYQEAMFQYGSDKPDLRFESKIEPIDDFIPNSLKGMLTSLSNPVVEMFKLSLYGEHSGTAVREFITGFMSQPSSAQFSDSPDGMPGIAIYDPSAPISGLMPFGHEAASKVEELFEPEPYDVLIYQARPRQPFTGGSTTIGRIRQRIHEFALERDMIPEPDRDALLWVVDFPLFSPLEAGEEGQRGSAGFCSTHHPFTAPKPGQDLSLLVTDPAAVLGDHYDLVCNGVELGGGSRRIHHAAFQEMIFRDVLRMPTERVEDFRHLLNVLESGCPPHAGFALGFDRLVALLRGRKSVRDVIAFPKVGGDKGTAARDALVGSPSMLTPGQMKTYGLSLTSQLAGTGTSADERNHQLAEEGQKISNRA